MNREYGIRIKALFLSLVLVLGTGVLSGCSEPDDGRSEEIELVEPVGVVINYVNPERRNLYTSTTYAGVVCPEVVEESLATQASFEAYTKSPGEIIKKGEMVLKTDTTQLDEQIKNLTESLSDMAKSHREDVADLNEVLTDAQKDYDSKKEIFERLESNPVPVPSYPQDDSQPWKDYLSWKSQYGSYDSSTRYAYLALERAKLNLKENEELYKLDYDYKQSQLKDLKNKRNSQVLNADTDGTVVAIKYFERNNYIAKNDPQVALGNLDVREIKCKFITRGLMNTATDVYAVIHGKRYEVEYHTMSTDEYKRIYDRDAVVYTTFTVLDEDDPVPFGSAATIVIVSDRREQILCVPANSVNKDENGEYVYVYDGDRYDIRYIKVGMTDGVYTEVLSGLSEEDKVKTSQRMPDGSVTGTVKLGSVGTEFNEIGQFFYTATETVMNPVKYGTTYVDEILVSRNQKVEKGDPLVKIHVVADTIEIQRRERMIQRETAKLNDLIKDDEDKNKRAIVSKKEYIAAIQKELKEMRNDAKRTVITAPCSGVVLYAPSFDEGDLLAPDSGVLVLSDINSCFVRVEDQKGRLSYGDSVTVSFSDFYGNVTSAPGQVVIVNPMALSRSLNSNYYLIKVSSEGIKALSEAIAKDPNSRGYAPISVTGRIRVMDNVLLVPRKAVTEKNGSTYVYVKEADGTVRMVPFISGGMDSTSYWVAEGLSEGTTICLE